MLYEGASAGDLNMYFSDTYVGFRKDGEVLPFYIRGVNTSRNGPKFIGYLVIDAGGETESFEALASNSNLILEVPEVGYVRRNGRNHWLSMSMTNRSTKKGLCTRRVEGEVQVNDRVAFQVYQKAEQANGDWIRLHFLQTRDHIEYKGRKIGTLEGQALSLKGKFSYLTRYINRIFPQLTITEVE